MFDSDPGVDERLTMSEALQAMILWYPLFAVPAIVGSGLVYLFFKETYCFNEVSFSKFVITVVDMGWAGNC